MDWGVVMNYVVLDLEFNNLYQMEEDKSELYFDAEGSSLESCPNEIIEIGAVKLDKNMRCIDTFKVFIIPNIFRKFNPKIKELTGITEEDLATGTTFLEALQKLESFVGNESIICSWAKDDAVELIRNAHHYGQTSIPWLNQYIDLQDYCTKVLGEKNVLSLKSALLKLRIKVDEEKLHDALNDSIYTSEVFRRVYNFRAVQQFIIRDIVNMPAIRVKDFTGFNLDESKLQLSCPKCGTTVEMEYPLKFFSWRFIGLGFCNCCSHKIFQKVIIKQTLAGDQVYDSSVRILTEEEYLDHVYRFEHNKLVG